MELEGGGADADANQTAGERPLPPEPVLAEAAEPSSTEPSPFGIDVPEFYHVQMHSLRFPTLLLRRDAAASYTHVMERILRHGVATWYVDGEPVADGGYGDDGGDYRNGGFGGVPASDEVIAALPVETTAGEGEGEARGKECAVCLEAYEAGDTLRTMPCAHGFHERCIFEWLRVSRLCPLCRFALPAAVETESPFIDREEEARASDS
ncbi:hypothetical protein C2845_PM17G01630 [Panicum miliaceum]|uniref:RING-type domain-containing protein n=1 Tax=Panicum miliaceum TaxID=4540 RepID=A0A3L6Q1V7_PANMI|nr:hypothetical protein C2845_PM17G01630 [Panicum miliaceum]